MTIIQLLSSQQYANITPFDPKKHKPYIFDLSENNAQLTTVNLNDKQAFSNFIFNTIKDNRADFGLGKFNENRIIYNHSNVFDDSERRSVHLGLDIWAKAGTTVYCPFDGIVHSFRNNNQHGDYGPTIILQHQLHDVSFYTLYGHLSQSSIEGIDIGQRFKKGQILAYFGEYEENVHWPPHLHFQIITDMLNYKGDFPGVCKLSEKEYWINLCPDPNIIAGFNI